MRKRDGAPVQASAPQGGGACVRACVRVCTCAHACVCAHVCVCVCLCVCFGHVWAQDRGCTSVLCRSPCGSAHSCALARHLIQSNPIRSIPFNSSPASAAGRSCKSAPPDGLPSPPALTFTSCSSSRRLLASAACLQASASLASRSCGVGQGAAVAACLRELLCLLHGTHHTWHSPHGTNNMAVPTRASCGAHHMRKPLG